MSNAVITRVDAVTLKGKRPRAAGSNARLGYHGDVVNLPVVRLTTTDGVQAFGRSSASQELLTGLPGRSLDEFVQGTAVRKEWLGLELPLLDLAARIAGDPVFRFVSGDSAAAQKTVRSYDTSLYFDDLDLPSDEDAAALIASEARDGWERGHRAFKIKVGRGARWMPLEAGTVRDIAIMRAVRDAVGPDATVMVDANNGWNLNLTKRVLTDVADVNLYWLEEAFHEDNVLYEDLHEWQAAEGMHVLIADGEGVADSRLEQWARDGVIDVVQYNIFARGFGGWHALGRELDVLGVKASPHTYGGGVSNYVASHVAAMLDGLELVEWDQADFAEIDASGFVITDGAVTVPTTPGFGLELDHEAFEAAVKASGISLIHD